LWFLTILIRDIRCQCSVCRPRWEMTNAVYPAPIALLDFELSARVCRQFLHGASTAATTEHQQKWDLTSYSDSAGPF
jgi:hypothetical protein